MKNKLNKDIIKSKKTELKLNKDDGKHNSSMDNEDIFESEYDPKSDPDHIIIFDCELDSVEEYKAVDLLFLLDTTGSMNCYLKTIKKIMRKIIWDMQKCLSKFLLDEINVLKVGIVTYKDHEDEEKRYLTNIDIDLTRNLKEVNNIIMSLSCGGGKDEPEAVLDGLKTAIYDAGWRNESIKFIFHILDAPCHGKKYNDLDDDKLESCPNNIDVEELFYEMRNKNINYYIIKLNDSINIMTKEFAKYIKFETLSPEVYFDKSDVMQQD